MNELVTVFEVTAGSNGIRADALFRFAIGIVSLIAGVWTILSSRTREGFLKELVHAIFMIGWGGFWLVLHMPLWRIATTDMHHLLDVYQSGQSEITEGVVHVTHEQPAHGHSSGDKIAIGNKTFEISHVPPAEPEACRLLAPQRGLIANRKEQKLKPTHHANIGLFTPGLKCTFPETSNSASPPAELGVYLRLIISSSLLDINRPLPMVAFCVKESLPDCTTITG